MGQEQATARQNLLDQERERGEQRFADDKLWRDETHPHKCIKVSKLKALVIHTQKALLGIEQDRERMKGLEARLEALEK